MSEVGKSNIAYHSVRLNLDNEKHRRVHMVLTDLNTDVHKSINHFMVEAVDSYISRLGGSGRLEQEEKPQKEGSLYVTREDLDAIRREIKDEMKNEIIILLGAALTGAQPRQMPEKRIGNRIEPEYSDVDEATVELASAWG